MRVVWMVCCLGSVGCRIGFDPRPDPLDADERPATCRPGPFATDFHAVPSWVPYQTGTATVALTARSLRVETGTTEDSASGIRSKRFEHSNLRIAIEIPEMVNTASEARAYFCLSDCEPDVFEAMMRQQHGNLLLEVASQGGVIQTRAYDPSADRHWQARETAGLTYWETSPDGVAWTTFGSYPTPPSSKSAELWFGAWNNAASDGGGATFRNLSSCLEL